jgi:cytochrome c peroxidase
MSNKITKLVFTGLLILVISFGTFEALASGVLAAPVGSDAYYPLVYGDNPTKAQLMSLGKKIFFDPNLSASGKMS